MLFSSSAQLHQVAQSRLAVVCIEVLPERMRFVCFFKYVFIVFRVAEMEGLSLKAKIQPRILPSSILLSLEGFLNKSTVYPLPSVPFLYDLGQGPPMDLSKSAKHD